MSGYTFLDQIPLDLIRTSYVIQGSSEPRKFHCFSTAEELENFLHFNATASEHFCEIGVATRYGSRPVKPFIDFDYHPPETSNINSPDIFLKIILSVLIDYMAKEYDVRGVTEKDFLFFPMDRTKPKKLSFHAVLDRQIFFRNMKAHENFIQGFKCFVGKNHAGESFLKKYIEFIDTTVYKRDDYVSPDSDSKQVYFSLRLPLCSKEGRLKKIPNGAEFADCLVLKYDDSIEPLFLENKLIQEDNGFSMFNRKDTSRNEHLWTPQNDKEAIALARTYLPFDKKSLEMKDRFNRKKIISFKRKDSGSSIECCICDKSHRSLVPFAYFGSNTLTLQCFSNIRKNRGKPKIIVPLLLSHALGPIPENLTLRFVGKVVSYKNNKIYLKTWSGRGIIQVKGAAVVEMVCPLFQWDISVVNEMNQEDGEDVYHLCKVNAVKLIPLKEGQEWKEHSWRHLHNLSVKNLYSDYKQPGAENAVQFYNTQASRLTTEEFIQKLPDCSLRNIWFTEPYLLRLCNDYPDTYRTGQNEKITVKTLREVLLFVNCSELFNDRKRLTWLLENLTITPQFKDYIRKAPDFKEDTHSQLLQFCDMQQSILRELYGEKQGCSIVSKIYTNEMCSQFNEFIAKYNTEIVRYSPVIESCTIFGHTLPERSKDHRLVIFYLKRFFDAYESLIKEVMKPNSFNLLANHYIEERTAESDQALFTYDEQQNHYMFPVKFRRRPTIGDTIEFVNNVIRKVDEKKCSVTFNPDHCWNHLKALWQYREAELAGNLDEWKIQQLNIQDVEKHELWQGSIFYIFMLI